MKYAFALLTVLLQCLPPGLSAEETPQSVTELWADFDPRREALEVEVVREWKEDGGVYRCVRYLIGSFKGKPARMAAFYGFPEGAKGRLPAVWVSTDTRLNAEHKGLWQNWTRKVTDPRWRGAENASLAINLTMSATNDISIVAIENEWRSYRGSKKTFACRQAIPADAKPQNITLHLADFRDSDGASLTSWSQLDQLGMCAGF